VNPGFCEKMEVPCMEDLRIPLVVHVPHVGNPCYIQTISVTVPNFSRFPYCWFAAVRLLFDNLSFVNWKICASAGGTLSNLKYMLCNKLITLSVITNGFNRITSYFQHLEKQFPRCAEHWCESRPNESGIDKQPTIVNQQDLHGKTKLKLFISKRQKTR